MKLAQLLSIYPQLRWGNSAYSEVESICDDTRQIGQKSVFIAIKGTQTDGHQFLSQAIKAGAIALVVEEDRLIPGDYAGAVVKVPNSREALNKLANKFYGEPAQNLYCIGVTGTNGKTSVCYMIEAILSTFGWKTGVMGTIDHHIGEHIWESQLTTPGPLTLFKRLREFVALGAKAVTFEVSSHAISQHRPDFIPFSALVFTNLSRDHLDYHCNMEDYFKTKEQLFNRLPLYSSLPQVHAVINKDDEFGQKIHCADKVKAWTYGQESAHFTFKILREDFSGSLVSVFTPRGDERILIPMIGRHNIYNALAAIAVGINAGASLEVCKKAIEGFSGVPGRLQAVTNSLGVHIFVDYAHTDDALSSVLSGLNSLRKKIDPNIKIITVFGCGGDRDKGKRPLMMKAAMVGADYVIVTSDNPRKEDPQKIINDAIRVVPKSSIDNTVFVEIDRRTAIRAAIKRANRGDVVLIAGKGHENYQIIGSEKIHFSDSQVVEEVLSEC